jgi:hypothetical protein
VSIHLEPIFFTVRIFADGKSWGDEYKAVLTVQKMGEVGFCSGCHGDINIMDYREVERALSEHGIKKMKWNRGSRK